MSNFINIHTHFILSISVGFPSQVVGDIDDLLVTADFFGYVESPFRRFTGEEKRLYVKDIPIFLICRENNKVRNMSTRTATTSSSPIHTRRN
jgi:hypothetical protein